MITEPAQQNQGLPIRNASQTTLVAQVDEASETQTNEPANDSTDNPSEFSDEQLLDMLENFIDDSTPPANETSPQIPTAKPPTGAPSENTAGEFPDVNVTVVGDELMLYSNDPEALNDLEAMLESAVEVIPPSTSWTVFTLQSADATEVSLMLEQLLPYSNVSTTSAGGGMLGSISGAASSLGSGIAEMTGLSSIASVGQSLRIIPDTRLNALFVSGPRSQVQEVESMLRVLDATEWPDNLRNKISRLIPLEHADADDVLRMVKEAYKVYIEPPQQQNNRNNPLAAMMGGGRGRGGEEENSQIKMQVSVDSNTNQLVVWADDSLYQEVKQFVESVDESARQARRTVRVVSLQNTNSSTIKGALGTLMPKVNVSSTSSRQSNNSQNSSSQNNNNNSQQRSAEEQERVRQFFEQRMRERMQGGGGGRTGASPFGGGRPGGGGGSPFGGGRPGGGGGRPGGR